MLYKNIKKNQTPPSPRLPDYPSYNQALKGYHQLTYRWYVVSQPPVVRPPANGSLRRETQKKCDHPEQSGQQRVQPPPRPSVLSCPPPSSSTRAVCTPSRYKYWRIYGSSSTSRRRPCLSADGTVCYLTRKSFYPSLPPILPVAIFD